MLRIALMIATMLAARAPDPPATQPASPVEAAFNRLASRDPEERQSARFELMGLSRQDLPELRRLVDTHRPLAPGQISALPEIVQHVYLTGEPYQPDSRSGFLGVQLGKSSITLEDESEPADNGVVIVSRMPGFVAFRVLQDGDVILGVKEKPDKPFRTRDDLSECIRQFDAGATVNLEVLRGGKLLIVPLKLGQRPMWAGGFESAQILQQRDERAEAYWQKEFAPLLEEGVS